MAECSAKAVATSAPEVGQQQASGILGANDSFRDFEQVAKVSRALRVVPLWVRVSRQ
jgi:hypothetical protein